jgi:hypothetical protein
MAQEVAPVQQELQLSQYRCETCDFFIQKKKNLFGVESPFCASPRIVEYLKAKPETVVDTPTTWRIKERYMNEQDGWHAPMMRGEIEQISILGCMGHSKYSPRRDRYETIRV